MFLKQINQLKGNSAFRLSAAIAIVFLVSLVVFNLTFQPLIQEYVLKKHDHLIQHKLNQFRSQFNTEGLGGLIQTLRQYDEEANIQGILIRIVDEHDSVIWLTHYDNEIVVVLKGNIKDYISKQGEWTIFSIPTPLLVRIRRLLIGPPSGEPLILLKSAKLDDNITIQVGHSFRYAKGLRDTISVKVRYVSFLFATLLFLCSIVLIHLALRPLKDILSTISNISSGDMTSRVRIRNRINDFGQMATMFNHMLDKTESLVVRMKESLDNVAHDLRTPLSRMRLSIERAVQKEDKDILKEALFDCAEEVGKLERLVKTVMDISEAEAETMNLFTEKIDLNELINESVHQYDFLINEKNLDVKLQLAEDLYVSVDPNRIRQVLNNLIDNAIKYTPEGGKIELLTQDNGTSVLLTVRDNGIGISNEDQNHIFDRLYRADKSRSAKGQGLGLSLVKAILQAHRSEIKVKSELGQGASFHILLPKNYKEDSTLNWKKLQTRTDK